MNLASLFSGGKDSTSAIYEAQKQGHTIACLLTISPESDDSHLLHHPNVMWTRLQSQSMGIPQIMAECNSSDTDDELRVLEDLVDNARERFGITGLVHGGMSSRFQKTRFEDVCSRLNLTAVSPLWGMRPLEYMTGLVQRFDFVMTSVSSDGLDDSWLGRIITPEDIQTLSRLSAKFGFNLNFEGGEAETFVVDCPLFARPIRIKQSLMDWDGYRGRFQIADAELNHHA